MILDDLFTFAGQKYVANEVNVVVFASVTTNRTGGLNTETNSASATNDVELQYAPGGVTVLQQGPASFSGHGLTISAPIFEPYHVSWQGSNSAVATVDMTTNVIYATLGKEFVTVSLCNVLTTPGRP
jgi:hypothetical protein